MNLLNNTDTEIKYLYHISDIHIRNHTRHQEYREVFDRLYIALSQEFNNQNESDEGLIVITGDIVHSKSQISPQLNIELRDFLTNLSKIMPVIMIAGNHDLNLSNRNTLDTLTSVLYKLELPNLYYLKESGIYQWNNIQFSVMSVIDYPLITAQEFPELENNPYTSSYKIGLLHATLNGSKIATSRMPLTNDKYRAADFVGYDYVLLGDIHLHQFMNSAKTIAYPGSLIQQSFGETLKQHGYLKWSLANNQETKLIEIPNDYGFINLHVRNQIIHPPNLSEKLLQSRNDGANKLPYKINLKLTFDDHSPINLGEDYIRQLEQNSHLQLFQNIIVPFTPNLKQMSSDALPTLDQTILPNLNNVDYQKSLITDYLGSDHDFLDPIHDLHSKLSHHVMTLDSVADEINIQQWKIQSLEFTNAFSFKGHNMIDFTQLNGIIGIIGPNFSGKSNILDIILFALFDKSSRGERNDIITSHQIDMNIKLCFRVGEMQYLIERIGHVTFTRDGLPKTKIDVRFSQNNLTENKELDLTGENRHHTNRLIQNVIGTYDDFVLTTLKLQDNGVGNLIKLSNSQRKERLVDLLRLNILDDYAKLANNNSKDYKKQIELHQSEIKHLPEKLSEEMEEILDSLLADKRNLNLLCLELNKNQNNLNELNEKLQSVDLKLVNQTYLSDMPKIDPSCIRESETELKKLHADLAIYKCRLKPLYFGMSYDELLENINLYKQTISDEEDVLYEQIKLEKEYRVLLKGLRGNQLEFKEKLIDYSELVAQVASLRSWIDHCRGTNKKLLTLEYDHDCKYCMNNIFVKDAISYRDQLQEREQQLEKLEIKLNESQSVRDELDLVEKELTEIMEKLDQINLSAIRNQLNTWTDELKRLKKDRKNLESNMDIEAQVNDIQTKINQTQNDRDQLWELWEKSQLMEQVKAEKIKETANISIRENIHELQQVIRQQRDRRASFEQKIMNSQAREQFMIHQLERHRFLTKNIKDLQQEMKVMGIYLQALGKDGIPKYLIGKYLPEFERVVNLIMSDLVDFRIKMEINEKKWNLHVVYDDRILNVDLCSGYEKFVVGLGIKCALFHLSQMSKPQFMVIDEGFGAIDQQHLSEISKILNYLRSKYDFILLITHIESIKDELDGEITIQRQNQYSHVNNLNRKRN